VTAPAGQAGLALTAPAPRPGPLVQLALLAGPLLSMLDSSIVNVAVEPITSELHASLTVVQWTGLITGLSTALAPRWLTGLTVRVTVLAGFAVLAVASLGLLLIGAATPLWLIALILACRSVSVGLVITPLLQALVQPLRPDQLGDANTLFNTWQRIAGSFGIGLVAALYTTRARSLGPVDALHSAGLVLVAIALAGALGALALPAARNPAMNG